jgi:hypothetical protein
MVVRAPQESIISERLDGMMKTQDVFEQAVGFQCEYAFDGDEEWQREWNGVNGAEEGVGDVAIFNDGSGNTATLDDSDPTKLQASSTTATQASPSPPRSPQQMEDGVYQAFTRQWCFAADSGWEC